MNDFVNELLAAGVGVIAGWLTRYWVTPHEKQVGHLEIISKLSIELNMTNDELVESFQNIRKMKKQYAVLIGYLVGTLEVMKKHGISPLPLPDELETDPDLLRFFRDGKQ